MTDQLPPSESSSKTDSAEHRLEYGSSDRPSGARMVLRCFAGMFCAFAVFAVVTLGALTGPFADSLGTVWAALAIGVFLIACWAMAVRRRPGWRPFAAGLWIGLGIGLLIEGACFAVLTSIERSIN